MAEVLPNMYKMVDGIHKANPDARVVSFGYDTMFGGLGCGSVPKDMFPQCYNGQDVPKEEGNRCFNTQFLRIQEAMDWPKMAIALSLTPLPFWEPLRWLEVTPRPAQILKTATLTWMRWALASTGLFTRLAFTLASLVAMTAA